MAGRPWGALSRPGVPAASLSTQGVAVEHAARLGGLRYAASLQREGSAYHRALTAALRTLVRPDPGPPGGRAGRGLGPTGRGPRGRGWCILECRGSRIPGTDSCGICSPRAKAVSCIPGGT